MGRSKKKYSRYNPENNQTLAYYDEYSIANLALMFGLFVYTFIR